MGNKGSEANKARKKNTDDQKRAHICEYIDKWLCLLLGVFCLFGLIKMHVSTEMLARAKFNFHLDNLEAISHRDYFLFFKNSFVFTCRGFPPHHLTLPLS